MEGHHCCDRHHDPRYLSVCGSEWKAAARCNCMAGQTRMCTHKARSAYQHGTDNTCRKEGYYRIAAKGISLQLDYGKPAGDMEKHIQVHHDIRLFKFYAYRQSGRFGSQYDRAYSIKQQNPQVDGKTRIEPLCV